MKLRENEKQKLIAEGHNLNFMAKIQSVGGMKFGERYTETGNGYVACINVYGFAEEVSTLWLTNILNIEKTVATMDCATANKQSILKDLNRSIGELKDRAETGRTTIERSDAYYEMDNLKLFAHRITQGGEIVKLTHARIFVYSNAIEELEKKIDTIKKDLSSLNHKTCILLFQSKEEYLSIFNKYDDQVSRLKLSSGSMLPSNSIGGGVPFHHTALKDPRGMYLGQTSTGGPFIFDPFYSTNTRRFFNGFILGLMGYGKSTLMKQLEEGLVARNCFIRGFDKARDYYDLIKNQGGKIIDLSGGEGMINPLEVFATKTDVSGRVVDELGSFMNHLTKVTNIIRFLNPKTSEIDLMEFKSLLRSFYIHYGLIDSNFMQQRENIKITGLKPNEYPTFTEFNNFLQEVIFPNPTPERERSLEILKFMVKEIVEQHGPLFDGHSTIENFETEQIVMFDIDGISQLDKEVFNCQLFSALTMIWNHALKNGRKMKELYEENKIGLEDIKYFMVFLDECHNIVNTNNLFAVDYIISFQREMRKFFAGILFATQSPNEILPDGANSSEKSISAIKTVFELTQYKFFLNMSNSVLGSLKKVLGDSLTETEYDVIPNLKIGEAVVQTSNSDSYTVSFDPEKEQLERYKGGQ